MDFFFFWKSPFPFRSIIVRMLYLKVTIAVSQLTITRFDLSHRKNVCRIKLKESYCYCFLRWRVCGAIFGTKYFIELRKFLQKYSKFLPGILSLYLVSPEKSCQRSSRPKNTKKSPTSLQGEPFPENDFWIRQWSYATFPATIQEPRKGGLAKGFFLQSPASHPSKQQIHKGIGPSSTFRTQSATGKRGVNLCKSPLFKDPL